MSAAVAPSPSAPQVAAAPEAVVRGRAVVRRFGNGRGVGPVDLDLLAGETLALMGPNGCGKTTLLRVLASVARAQSGQLRWWGGDASAARRRLGLALDSALEESGLTARQATHFWCAQWVADPARVAARTDAILNRLGLGATADDRVGTFSYGMRRRLALAAALVHEPDLAVLDEPTAGLDPEGATQLVRLLADRSARGMTTLVASNDPRFVESVADRVAFLDEGLMMRCAAPAALLAALPRGRIADLVVDGAPDLHALRALPGVAEVTAEPGARLRVRFEGDRTIAGLVAAADAPGGRLREVRLRRPDLSDCFHQLTGHPLERNRER